MLLLICDSAHLHADEAVDLLLLLEGTALHLLGGDVSLEHADLVVQRLLAFRLVLLPLLLRVQLLVLLHDFAVVPVVNVPFLLREDVQPTVSAHNNKYIYPPPTHSQPPFVMLDAFLGNIGQPT